MNLGEIAGADSTGFLNGLGEGGILVGSSLREGFLGLVRGFDCKFWEEMGILLRSKAVFRCRVN